MKPKALRITVEIIAASLFLLLPLVVVPAFAPMADNSPLQPVLRGNILIHSMLIVYYYWNSYYGIPGVYFSGKKSVYKGMVFAILIVISGAPLFDLAYNPFSYSAVRYPTVLFLLSILARFMMITVISFAIASYSRLQKAEEERLRSELSYLKAQVNPHFLFNTLNSIYALTVTKSDNAPRALTQLASIMRYVMEEAAADQVPLRTELEYTVSYIELEKLRLTEKVKVEYSVTGDPQNRMIPPMLLLPIVENAFKHGISTENECLIRINGRITDKEMILEVENKKMSAQQERQGGLGLANIRRRLALIPGGNNSLEVSEQNGTFNARLVLKLL